MSTKTRKPTRQRAASRILRRSHVEEAPAQPTPQERCREVNGPENRERRTGGPQDQALYICRCGSAFQAVVTASVSCPHCGDMQAW
jgi:hypothetical protein